MRAFDWPAMMRAGLGGLGLRPTEFWAMTPVEFLMMLGLEGRGRRALTRDGLADLRRRFPDGPDFDRR